MAPVGQTMTHSPHSMHFSGSMVGAAVPAWVIAPVGQCRMAGHRWFWGQRDAWTRIGIPCTSLPGTRSSGGATPDNIRLQSRSDWNPGYLFRSRTLRLHEPVVRHWPRRANGRVDSAGRQIQRPPRVRCGGGLCPGIRVLVSWSAQRPFMAPVGSANGVHAGVTVPFPPPAPLPWFLSPCGVQLGFGVPFDSWF
jgi:hypothetical protein